MKATVHYTDKEPSTFHNVEEVRTLNDMAFVDDITHTNVEGVTVKSGDA